MSFTPSRRNALIALIVWVGITIGGGLIQAGGPSSMDELVSAGVVWGIPLAALFLLIAYRGKWSQLGLVAPASWRAARPVVIAVALLLVLAIVNGLPTTSVLLFLVINSMAVGISEELAFRGVVLRALLGSYSIRRAVLISALAFGAVHSLNALMTGEVVPALMQSGIAVGMGMWAASIRIRTGSLYPSILLHGLWDLALLIVISGTAGSPLSIVVSVSAILLAIGLGVWGWRTINTSLSK
jgi:membrane protease YdiL (CAAX protease family)